MTARNATSSSWHGFPLPTSSTNWKVRDQSQITNPYLKKFLTGVLDYSLVRSREREREKIERVRVRKEFESQFEEREN